MDGEAVRSSQSLHIVYQADPGGYVFQRHLCTQGLHCDVVAPSRIARPPGERIKTDQRDNIIPPDDLSMGCVSDPDMVTALVA